MKVAVRIVGLLLVLIASLGIPALAAGPAPTVSSPKVQNAPLVRPTVTGFGPAPCVEKGAILTVEGSSFGDAPTGKQAILAGRDFSLILEGKSWTSKAIAVVVPKDPRLVPGELYAIGIQDGSGKWISNIDKTFRICLPQPAAAQPAGGSAATVKPPTSTPIKVPAAAPLPAPSTASTVVQKQVPPAATSPSQPSGSIGTSTAPPAAPQFQPKAVRTGEIIITGVTFSPKAVRTNEISMTGAAFQPKAVRTGEISMTGAAFTPKAVRTNEISMTGAAFSPKAVRTGEISMTGASFSPKAVRTDEISMTGAGSQPTPVMP